MKPISFRPWHGMLLAGCAVLTMADRVPAEAPADQRPVQAPLRLVAADPYNSNPSFLDSVGNGFKRGVDNVTSFFTPKPKPKVEVHDDAISLSKPAKDGPDLRLAMGRVYEQSNRPAEAAKEYEQALKLGPKNPAVLSAYAQFKAREGKFDDAIRFYQQALRLTPDDPSLYNDIGLCFARRERHPEALSHLHRAIQFQPESPLYRNNIAAVLVEMNQPDEAMRHLLAVHPEAVAHYNLGYLLHKKGQSIPAAQHFAFALQRDPSLGAARYWLDRIGAHPGDQPSATAAWPGAQRQATWPPAQAPAAPTPVAQAPIVQAPAAGPYSQTAQMSPMASPPPATMTALPPVGPPPEAAPMPPSLSTMPTVGVPGYAQPDPRLQQAPVVGRTPGYENEIRRQDFVEVVEAPRRSATRLPSADEPAPLPDDAVRRLPRAEPRRDGTSHRLPPPVAPLLD